MCTASWLRRDGALHLFFNRDEQLGREPATPPAASEAGDVRYLAPRDGRAGGTWIAASASGLALALLNRSEGPRPERPGSRGRLIPRLIAAPGPDELATALAREGLADLPPFRLAALWLAADRSAAATWDGERLSWERLPDDAGLLCSSGLGDERATLERGAVWRRLRAERAPWGAEGHREFHRSHRPSVSAWSPCMHRRDAATVSYAEVELDGAGARMRYLDRPPCHGGTPVGLDLPRRAPRR
jgi:hypothetical protein